jgi:hypothetical protein
MLGATELDPTLVLVESPTRKLQKQHTERHKTQPNPTQPQKPHPPCCTDTTLDSPSLPPKWVGQHDLMQYSNGTQTDGLGRRGFD